MQDKGVNKKKHIGIGLLSFVGLVLLFGVPTGLIPTPWFMRMITAKSMDYVFLLLNSGLLGAYFGVYTFQRTQSHAMAATGSIANIFAVGCPICNKALVAILGTSAVMAYFEPLRLWIGMLSAGLIGRALFKKVKQSSCAGCGNINKGIMT